MVLPVVLAVVVVLALLLLSASLRMVQQYDRGVVLPFGKLQTVVDVAAEKNSTLVTPFPVELPSFFDRASEGHTAEQAANGHVAPVQPERV